MRKHVCMQDTLATSLNAIGEKVRGRSRVR
jgi:hypothetical protein